MKNSSFIFFILLIVGIFLLTAPALALDPLVPACGRTTSENPCTTCDALILGKNISDFILFYLVPALSSLFFIYAGFMILLGGGIPAQVAKGQNIFRTTVYGLLIIFLSWMIVNTVLRTVAGDENIAENWWKLECRENITTGNGSGGVSNKKYACQNNQCVESASGTLTEPTCNNSCGTVATISVTLAAAPATIQACNVPSNTLSTDPRLANCQKLTISLSGLDVAVNYRLSQLKTGTSQPVQVDLPAVEGETDVFEIIFYNNEDGRWSIHLENIDTGVRVSNQVSVTVTPVSGTGLTCRDNGVNLCQGSTTCAVNACNQYSASITKAAASTPINGITTAALIRAIMFNESSCNISAKSNSDPPSCGLMQLQPATANRFKSQCGVSGVKGDITCDWLRSSANAEASICIAAKYLKSLAGGTCGTSIRNIAAGYNGGVGACDQSRDCATEKSCDGVSVKKWECLYDNSQHTVCNTGYNETRAYAPKVLACYNVNK